MEYVRQIIDSDKLHDMFDLPISLRNKPVEVIILPVDDKASQPPVRKIKLDFLKDVVPPLPDSFFEPLPEEELRLWE